MLMKSTFRTFLILACVAMLAGSTGCKSTSHEGGVPVPACAMAPSQGDAGATTEQLRSERMLIWKADLSIEVWNIATAVADAAAMAERQGGFVEQKSDRGETAANLTLRIPAKSFKAAVAGLETLGTVTSRNLAGEDVTEQYVDVAARLKNKLVLRDRLKLLLEKAVEIKDLLAIETELNRVQADIDSMAGRIKSLQGQADYATINLSLERKAVLGPLGYLCKGIAWGVEKLFYLRD